VREVPAIRTAVPGPRSRELFARLSAVENPAFAERRLLRFGASAEAASIVLDRGEHQSLWDVDGNRYLDLAAGFGAAILGHGPSAAHDAAREQIGSLTQGLGDLYASERKIELLEALAGLHPEPGARAMLTQSGADAVTAALKTCVLATGKPGVLAFEGAYHGLSYAPLAACGFAPGFREPFAGQLGAHVRFAPYPRASEDLATVLEEVKAALDSGAIGAVLVEPVLGRGGVIVPPSGFLAGLAALARGAGALLVADEIWTGMGRSGSLLRSIAEGVTPDVLCLGKGLGASFPISACVGRAEVMSAWARGGAVIHTSTHAGAPLGCAAALATLTEVRVRDLPARAAALGDRLAAALRERLPAALAREVRHAGLLVGVELSSGSVAANVSRRLLERGYVTTLGGLGGEVIVLTPPLTIEEDLLLGFVDVMGTVLTEAP
jgi:4-aminobutyrate aminotransferase/(S)-3-amino-2-methylpropionate transaminase